MNTEKKAQSTTEYFLLFLIICVAIIVVMGGFAPQNLSIIPRLNESITGAINYINE
jgi:uncharacterized protein (UPF0333 family)